MRVAQQNVEQIVLEKLRYSIKRHFPEELFVDRTGIELINYMDVALNAQVMELRATLAGEKIKEIRWPSNWKEAFKERWFPRWLLKRFPVRYSNIENMDLACIYPQIKLPKERYYIAAVPKAK